MKEYPEMMTVKETADFLRCSPSNIYVRLRAGEMPGDKIGKEWRISKTALINLNQENMKKAKKA
jgi:excisionase family DNA binding protein